MATTTTVRAMLYFYCDARNVYERFMSMAGSHPEQARNAVALLLCLDPRQAIRHLPSLSPARHRRRRGQLHPRLPAPAAEPDQPPAAQSGGPLHLRALPGGRHRRGRRRLPGLQPGPRRARRRRPHLRRPPLPLATPPPDGPRRPSPGLEAPYTCRPVAVPEDCGSMFLTFSKGQPIERQEIFDYFRQKSGDCIVRVLMYGRIILSEAFVSLVLNGEPLVKITIANRQIWLRKYIYPEAEQHV
ncbi:unnamed protein product [Urochloa decumbens]|uniref:Uncharacterized protein n=1 Tax=Urochloa decumbens TaxID=240449 RepID=A0ABC9H752_9POAL